MAIEKITRPYEFLARWRDGVLAGAHIGFIEEVVEDGQVLSQKVLDVMPVAVAGATGFPLTDILTQLQADAIAERDAAVAANTTLQASLAEATAALEAAQAELAQLKGEVPQIIVAQS